MFQQINLYEPIFREEPKLFSASAICGGLGFVAAGLVAIALFSWWRVSALERLLRTVQSQEAAQTKFIEHGNSIVNLGESPQSVEARLTALNVDLERRRQALRYLRGGERGGEAGRPDGNSGFSGRMAALAREQLDGLWVTGALFTADTGRFELSGSAQSAALVPVYLARLAGEQALAGIPLQSIEIRQPKKPVAGEIEFTVSSATSIESKGPAPAPVLTARSSP
jgi:hypothetical protein